MEPTVLSIVEALQPYHRINDPDGHPLALLNELSNTDKHRTLHTTSMRSKDSEITLVSHSGARIRGTPAQGPVGHGDVLAIFPLGYEDYAAADRDLGIEVRGSSFIAFRDPGAWGTVPVTVLLEELVKYLTDRVLQRFEPFF